MFYKTKNILILVLLIGTPINCSVAADKQVYTIANYGTLKCSETISLVEKQDLGQVLEVWLGGYFTAANSFIATGNNNIDVLAGIELGEILKLTIKECKKSPNDFYAESVSQVLANIVKSKIK